MLLLPLPNYSYGNAIPSTFLLRIGFKFLKVTMLITNNTVLLLHNNHPKSDSSSHHSWWYMELGGVNLQLVGELVHCKL